MSRRNKTIMISVILLVILGLGILPFIGDDTTTVMPAYSLGKITSGSLKAEGFGDGGIPQILKFALDIRPQFAYSANYWKKQRKTSYEEKGRPVLPSYTDYITIVVRLLTGMVD